MLQVAESEAAQLQIGSLSAQLQSSQEQQQTLQEHLEQASSQVEELQESKNSLKEDFRKEQDRAGRLKAEADAVYKNHERLVERGLISRIFNTKTKICGA